jgi:hypothetical protein
MPRLRSSHQSRCPQILFGCMSRCDAQGMASDVHQMVLAPRPQLSCLCDHHITHPAPTFCGLQTAAGVTPFLELPLGSTPLAAQVILGWPNPFAPESMVVAKFQVSGWHHHAAHAASALLGPVLHVAGKHWNTAWQQAWQKGWHQSGHAPGSFHKAATRTKKAAHPCVQAADTSQGSLVTTAERVPYDLFALSQQLPQESSKRQALYTPGQELSNGTFTADVLYAARCDDAVQDMQVRACCLQWLRPNSGLVHHRCRSMTNTVGAARLQDGVLTISFDTRTRTTRLTLFARSHSGGLAEVMPEAGGATCAAVRVHPCAPCARRACAPACLPACRLHASALPG